MRKKIFILTFIALCEFLFLSACSKSRPQKIPVVTGTQYSKFSRKDDKILKPQIDEKQTKKALEDIKEQKQDVSDYKTYQPQQGEQVRIGLLLPLSGKAKKVGQALKEAALMAQYEIADDNFLMQFYDTKGTPEGAEMAVTEAAMQGVRLIIGPVFSSSVKAITPQAKAAGISVIAFTTDPSALGDGVYTIGLLVKQQIERIVSYAYVNGISRFAVVVPDNPLGHSVVGALLDVTDRLQAEVSKVGYYSEKGGNISSVVSKLADYKKRKKALEEEKEKLKDKEDEISKEALKKLEQLDTLGNVDFDGILIPVGGTMLRSVASMLAYYDVYPDQVKFLGTSLWDSPSTRKETSLRGGWYPALPKQGYKEFIERFNDIYGYKPPRISSLAYDAVALTAVIVKESNNFDEKEITSKSGFVGIDGIFRLHKNGFCERGLSVMEVAKRKSKTISKAPNSFDENRYEFYNEPNPYKTKYNSNYGDWSLFEHPTYGEVEPLGGNVKYQNPSVIENPPFGKKAQWIEEKPQTVDQDFISKKGRDDGFRKYAPSVEASQIERKEVLPDEKKINEYLSSDEFVPVEEDFVITH